MTAGNREVMRLRPDLICRSLQMGKDRVWVLKDPLSREFFYFHDREFEILKQLDGERDVREIASACAWRFAPDYLAADDLVEFLADSRRKGLLSGRAPHRSAIDDPPTQRWWQNPLAIRLPGINPDRWLDGMIVRLGWLYQPAFAIASLIVCVAALVTLIVHFDQFADDAVAAATRSTTGWLATVAGVLALTKIIHEFSHALACKRLGGECREMGFMLLVGVPCLYSDVTDAWMFSERWKRIGVSLAGMAAELVLASVATFVWLFTADVAARDLCVTIMIVCSVTTVLFNGNPLLRYDGYFVLSDLVGIPNLASESTHRIRQIVRGWLWGDRYSSVGHGTAKPFRYRAFLVAYGLLSGLYRVVVYTVILLMLYRLAVAYDLGSLAAVMFIAAMTTWFVRMTWPVLRPPVGMMARSRSRSRRRWKWSLAALICLMVAINVPLPRRVTAPMSIRPADGIEIYVVSEGRREEACGEGDFVRAGDTILRLSNPTLELESRRLKASMIELEAELQSLRRQRSRDRAAGSRIPAVLEAIEANEARRVAHAAIMDRLTLPAPRDGVVFAPPSRAIQEDTKADQTTWRGTPLAEQNEQAWFQEGTLVCVLGDPILREAWTLLRQQDVALINVGQPVSLFVADHPRGSLTGTVAEIATTAATDVPDELVAAGLIENTSDSVSDRYYHVRVAIDDVNEGIVDASGGTDPKTRSDLRSPASSLPVRCTGTARIRATPASLLQRAKRFLREAFR